MKNATKSILAVLSLTLTLAACTPKTENAADTQDTVKIEEAAVDTTQTTVTDTTATTADTTVTQ